MKDLKETRIQVRVSVKDKKEIQRRAKEAGLTMAKYMLYKSLN